MRCPLCSSESNRIFEIESYWIRDCNSCSHRFTEISACPDHVERIYDDSYFTGGGAGYADYLQDAEILRRRGNWYGELLANYTDKGKVLDVGSAAGFILKGMTEIGWQGVGIEPNMSMVEFGRRHLKLDIRRTSIEDYSSDEKFDLVTMIQVMAHFIKPRDVFSKISKTLGSNGHLLIETWNRRSLSERILGTKWHEYSPPSVLQFFSEDGIERLAVEQGFERVAKGRPSKWISGSHAKSLIGHKFGDKSLITRLTGIIPDRLSLPYPAEDLFWVLYQKKRED